MFRVFNFPIVKSLALTFYKSNRKKIDVKAAACDLLNEMFDCTNLNDTDFSSCILDNDRKTDGFNKNMASGNIIDVGEPISYTPEQIEEAELTHTYFVLCLKEFEGAITKEKHCITTYHSIISDLLQCT